MALTFQVLPPAFQDRIEKAFNDVTAGRLPAFTAAKFYFEYFFRRVGLMCDPPTLARVQDATDGHVIGFVIPDVLDITLRLGRIPDVSVAEGVDVSDPALIYRDFQVVVNNLLSETTVIEDVLNGNIRIRKIPDVLEWFAPLAAILTAENVVAARDADLGLLDELLQESGY